MTEDLYIIFGWPLGLLSPVIVERIRRKHRAKELIATLLGELQALQAVMATVAYYLRVRSGTMDDKFLDWLRRPSKSET